MSLDSIQTLILIATAALAFWEWHIAKELCSASGDKSRELQKMAAIALLGIFLCSAVSLFVNGIIAKRSEEEKNKMERRLIESEFSAQWPYGSDRKRRHLVLLLGEMDRRSVWIARSKGDTTAETDLIEDDSWALLIAFNEARWGGSGVLEWEGEPFNGIKFVANDPDRLWIKELRDAFVETGIASVSIGTPDEIGTNKEYLMIVVGMNEE